MVGFCVVCHKLIRYQGNFCDEHIKAEIVLRERGYRRDYYKAHPELKEKYSKLQREWYARQSPEKKKELADRTKKWRAKNREKYNNYQLKYYHRRRLLLEVEKDEK